VRKSFRLHTKRPVESRAIIFPGNRRRQFHQLAFGEIRLQRRKQFIRNFRWRAGERGGKSHYILFCFREIRAGFELCYVDQLLFRESFFFSAHGRMNVNSKRTPHQHRCFQHRQALQARRQHPFRFRIHRHAHKLTQQPRVIRQNFRSFRNMAIFSFPEPVNQPHMPGRLFRLYSTDARQMSPPHFFTAQHQRPLIPSHIRFRCFFRRFAPTLQTGSVRHLWAISCAIWCPAIRAGPPSAVHGLLRTAECRRKSTLDPNGLPQLRPPLNRRSANDCPGLK